MTSSNALAVSLPSDTQIRLSRSFNYPRALVFEAFTKPEHMRNWFGQKDATVSVCDMDFRPGGAWRFVSRETDGNEYGFRGEYREIVPPERIVWTFEFEGMPGSILVEEFEFNEVDGTTTVNTVSTFDSTEARDGMLQSGMESGAVESYNRLEEYLGTLA